MHGGNNTKKTYSNLTEEQKSNLIQEYRRARSLGACDVLHAVCCAAHSVLNRGNVRTLNSGKGADAQAAALFWLVFSKEVEVRDLAWARCSPYGKPEPVETKLTLDNGPGLG